MRKVRTSVFETNSSSMHSISIYRVDTDDDTGRIIIGGIITPSMMFEEKGNNTEMGKLLFCMNLLFSMLINNEYNTKTEPDSKGIGVRVIGYINSIISTKCGSKLDPDIFPEEISSMYLRDPDEVFRNFVKKELNTELVGPIDSEENISTTLEAITKIIFDDNIKFDDKSIV